MNFQDFKQNVIQWATDRNFFAKDGATVAGQIKKGISECGELADNLAKGRDIKDDLGDNCVVAVVVATMIDRQYNLELSYTLSGIDQSVSDEILSDLTVEWGALLIGKYPSKCETIINLCAEMAEAHDIDIQVCFDKAWHDIKDRKGKMLNGVFIKESDTGNG